MKTDDDRAQLIAKLVVAMQSDTASVDSTFSELLHNTEKFLRESNSSLTIAQKLRWDHLTWIDHPWHCYKLKRLVSQIQNQDFSDIDEAEALKLLTRCCAMIEFGVDVDYKSYRRLREVVIDHNISAYELKSILRHSTIWWGTSVTATCEQNLFIRFFLFIWSMGRPRDGELLMQDHHSFTKSAILAFICFLVLGLVNNCFDLLSCLLTPEAIFDARRIIPTTLAFGSSFLIFWWIGPSSWFAVNKLKKLIDSSPQQKHRIN